MYFRAERIDPRALGEHLGDVAAATATVSTAAASRSSSGGSDNTYAPDAAGSSASTADHQLP
jgi:hypothetical protein